MQLRPAAGEYLPGGGIPYIQDEVTGGLGQKGNGYGFGLEIEFDLPDDAKRETRLTSTPAFHALAAECAQILASSEKPNSSSKASPNELTSKLLSVIREKIDCVYRAVGWNSLVDLEENPPNENASGSYSGYFYKCIVEEVHGHQFPTSPTDEVLDILDDLIHPSKRSFSADLIKAITRDLKSAGLMQNSRIHSYHAGRSEGYSDRRDGWRMEWDSTVDGELISPILFDTPATWEDLAKVLEILKKHGVTASPRAGGHIHVSTHNYDLEGYLRLASMVEQFQDVLFRLASDPVRRNHRGIDYTDPMIEPVARDSTLEKLKDRYGHRQLINYESVNEDRSQRVQDHVEFRMWDGTLDPAVIQARVKICLGMVAAAHQGVKLQREGGVELVGAHASNLSGATDESFHELAQLIFSDCDLREQFHRLYDLTSWQSFGSI
ncbi:amidoligase family protein [Streptomyces noursei]